jgi:hypothetical protein
MARACAMPIGPEKHANTRLARTTAGITATAGKANVNVTKVTKEGYAAFVLLNTEIAIFTLESANANL